MYTWIQGYKCAYIKSVQEKEKERMRGGRQPGRGGRVGHGLCARRGGRGGLGVPLDFTPDREGVMVSVGFL